MRSFTGRLSSPLAPLGHLVGAVAAVVVLLIGAGILMVVLDANVSNTVVSHVERWANTLTTPFHNLFTAHSLKENVAVNWGLAAVAYLLAGGIIRRLLVRL